MTALARTLLWQGLCVALMAALLASLGFWQLRRREWKEALIARIETRAAAAPVDAPAPGSWPQLKPEDYEFRRVRAGGRFELTSFALVFAQPPEGSGQEPGVRVLMPLRLEGGGLVIVDRGFVALSKSSAGLWRSSPAEPLTIEGLMRPQQSRNAFTPQDTPAKGLWYTADPVKIAADLSLDGAAPFVIEQDPGGHEDGLLRVALATPDIPNNHLSYAATWFTLAAALCAMFAFYAHARLKAA